MKPPPTFATITAINPPGSRLTRAGKLLAIGDRVTASDALTLATPGGVGGCVGMTAQIGVAIITTKLAPRMGLVFDAPTVSAPTIDPAPVAPPAEPAPTTLRPDDVSP